MKNLKKGLVAGLLSIIISLGAVMPSFAATAGVDDPYLMLQYMPNGDLFDPIWYSVNNPDVSKQYDNDTGDKWINDLYTHYINYGRAEGRTPYASGTDMTQTFDPSYLLTPDASNYAGYYKPLGVNKYLVFQALDSETLVLTNYIGSDYTLPYNIYYTFSHADPVTPSEKIYVGRNPAGGFEGLIEVGEYAMLFVGSNFNSVALIKK